SGAIFHIAELKGAIQTRPHGEVAFGNQLSIERDTGGGQAFFIALKPIHRMWVVFQAGNYADAPVTERNQVVHHGACCAAIIDANRRASGEFAAASIYTGNTRGNG